MLHSTLGSQLSQYRSSSNDTARDAWDFLIKPQPTRPDIMPRLGSTLTARNVQNTESDLEEYKRDQYKRANPYKSLFSSIKNWNWSKYGNSRIGNANAIYKKTHNEYIKSVEKNAEKLVVDSIEMLPEGDCLKQAVRDSASSDLKLQIKYVFLPDESVVVPPVGLLLVDHNDSSRKWTLSLNNATIERVPDDYDDLDTKHAMHAHFVAKAFEGTKLESTPIAPDAFLVCSGPSREAKAGRGSVITATDLAREVGAYIAAEYKTELENNRASTAREREIDAKAKAKNSAYLEGKYPLVKTLDAALKHNANGVRENVFQETVTLAKVGTGAAVGATENPIEAVHFGVRYMY